MNFPLSPTLRFVVLLLAALAAPLARAQLDVRIELERQNYVSYEPMMVQVTVTNTSGNDVVLGGPNNSSWVNFLVFSENGRPVTGIANPGADAIICRAGQSLQRKFNLPRHFHLIESGFYVVKASAYFPDLQRWINSNPSRFTINQAPRPQWQRSFALPPGHRMEGKYRKYQLFTFHDKDRSYLYVRMVDESTGMILMTHRLNSISPDRQLQAEVDASQNLHILCLGSPMVWAYHSIDPDGKILKRQFFRQGQGTPQLVKQNSGEVMTLGGTNYDPTEKPAVPPGGAAVIRRLSDRPSGIPLR
jgi:hypothetical protein